MTPRLRAAFLNLALAAASLLLGLGALEGLARWDRHRRAGGKEQVEAAHYVEHDPVLGWKKKPGARVTYRRREYTAEVAVNSRGLRDRERGYERPEGTVRVLALGDSFVEGYTVAFEETVAQVMEKELGPCPAEVLNGGTAAWSLDQEYLFYVHEGARYEPQVVVAFVYFNDVYWTIFDNHFGTPKPLLGREAGRLFVRNDPVPFRPGAPATQAPRPPAHGSAAWEWFRDRMARGAPRAYNRLAGAGLWEPLGGDEPDPQMRVYKRRQQPIIEKAWEQTDMILRALHGETARRGARLLLAYVPSRMEVSDRDWELTRLAYNMDERQWDRGLVARRLNDIARSAGFPVLDLTPALRAGSGGIHGEPYFLYDGHWNSLGHRLAGRAVAAELRRLGWVPGCGPAAR
ncbi:MAG TPA: hypothetical protein VFM29_10140 [Vicinamibacteria bacterium]|nr:hypothetical protein [Vicinamibacteria bacterium]